MLQEFILVGVRREGGVAPGRLLWRRLAEGLEGRVIPGEPEHHGERVTWLLHDGQGAFELGFGDHEALVHHPLIHDLQLSIPALSGSPVADVVY